MFTLKLPELGENIETAEVSRLLVSEGDTIEAEQSVMELDSDKASFPLPSKHAGRVGKIHVKEGDTVSVGQTLMEIEDGKTDQKPAVDKKTAAPPEKEDGDAEPSKPSASKPSAEPSKTPPQEEPKKEVAPAPQREDAASVPAGPATRRLARELGVELGEVHQMLHRRVTPDDVKAFVQKRLQQPSGKQAAPPLPDFARFGTVERRHQSAIARATAAHMSLAWRLIPHVTQHELADITELETQRRRLNEKTDKTQAKITVTAFALKAAVIALKAFPHFNSSLDGNDLIVKNYWHIGVAVDTERGLLVPVVRDVDQKPIRALAAELAELADKARKRTLTSSDMEGGTFTISNLGGIGGSHFTPIVNHPEVAILGIARARWQPMIADGVSANRLLLPLSLSYDHRVINGADGARFITQLAELLGDPFTLLTEV